ncbi:GntR family transcriptional regulator [Azospirillum sp. SYSU D00513]|uniref:GntR family transcriptional regulator n=1 Tax=Azospirillum sp. SYSU D00513 TaxID=2812561 RepID=UPI001A974116|nr:GntR family transcriptional regulator [Azospirillum sp. SYSU D00513]
MSPKLQRPASLTQQAVDIIRTRIIRGDFQLGEALSESTLAGEMGVSKTPVREALLQLKMEGLVDIQPQRGSFVFQMTPEEIAEISEYREILETNAIGLAIARHADALAGDMAAVIGAMARANEAGDGAGYRIQDAQFHQLIFDHCGNSYLANAFAGMSFRVQALRSRLSANQALNESSLAEHREILALVAAKDGPGARARLSRHIRDTTHNYMALLSEPEAQHA